MNVKYKYKTINWVYFPHGENGQIYPKSYVIESLVRFIKNYNQNRGFVFIVYHKPGEEYKQQIYFYINECTVGFTPELNKRVQFEIMLNKDGKPMAVEVQDEIKS